MQHERPAFLPPIESHPKDRNSDVRNSAVVALGRIGPAAVAAVPVLTLALKDAAVDVREATAVALGRIGKSSVEPEGPI